MFFQRNHQEYRSVPYSTLLIRALVVMAILIVAMLMSSFFWFRTAGVPTLAIQGNVILGQTVILHGSQFAAGKSLTITLDNQSLASTVLSDAPAIVNADGTFNVRIHIDAAWSTGSIHTVRVYDQEGNFLKSVDLTVVANVSTGLKSCQVDNTAEQISLGPVTEGKSQPVSAVFILCMQGVGVVDWTSSWDQQKAAWLQLNHTGHGRAPQPQEISVGALATKLKAGTYKAVVLFSSAQNATQIPLNVTFVVQPQPQRAPIPAPRPRLQPTAASALQPRPTAMPQPTPRPMPIPQPRPTATPTPRPTPQPTATPTPMPQPTLTPSPTPIATSQPTATPTSIVTPQPTATPILQPTPLPTPSLPPQLTPAPTLFQSLQSLLSGS